jgi:hypothetical protein
MPRTALTVTTTAKTGVVQPAMVAVDAANGNSFVNTGREVIEINNGGGSPITVTFVTTLTYQGYAIADQTVSVTNGTVKLCGPFDTALFNDTTDSTIGIDYSSGTSVTARVTKLGST